MPQLPLNQLQGRLLYLGLMLILMAACAPPLARVMPSADLTTLTGKLWMDCASSDHTVSHLCYLDLTSGGQPVNVIPNDFQPIASASNVFQAGDRAVLVSTEADNASAVLLAYDLAGKSQHVLRPNAARSSQFDPTGDRVAFLEAEDGAWQRLSWIGWDGTGYQSLSKWSVHSFTWLADGQSLVFSGLPHGGNTADSKGLQSLNIQTGEVTLLVPPPTSRMSALEPKSSPDGRTLSFLIGVDTLSAEELAFYDLKDQRRLPGASVAYGVASTWSPAGGFVAFSSTDVQDEVCGIKVAFHNLSIRGPSGSAVRLLNTEHYTCAPVYSEAGIRLHGVAWSPTNDLLAVHWQEEQAESIVFVRSDGTVIGRIQPGVSHFHLLRWTP